MSKYNRQKTFTIHQRDAGAEAFCGPYVVWLEEQVEHRDANHVALPRDHVWTLLRDAERLIDYRWVEHGEEPSAAVLEHLMAVYAVLGQEPPDLIKEFLEPKEPAEPEAEGRESPVQVPNLGDAPPAGLVDFTLRVPIGELRTFSIGMIDGVAHVVEFPTDLEGVFVGLAEAEPEPPAKKTKKRRSRKEKRWELKGEINCLKREVDRLEGELSNARCAVFNSTPDRTMDDWRDSLADQVEILVGRLKGPDHEPCDAEIDRLQRKLKSACEGGKELQQEMDGLIAKLVAACKGICNLASVKPGTRLYQAVNEAETVIAEAEKETS